MIIITIEQCLFFLNSNLGSDDNKNNKPGEEQPSNKNVSFSIHRYVKN